MPEPTPEQTEMMEGRLAAALAGRVQLETSDVIDIIMHSLESQEAFAREFNQHFMVPLIREMERKVRVSPIDIDGKAVAKGVTDAVKEKTKIAGDKLSKALTKKIDQLGKGIKGTGDVKFEFNVGSIFGQPPNESKLIRIRFAALQWQMLNRLSQAARKTEFEIDKEVGFNQLFGVDQKTNFITAWTWNELQMQMIERIKKALPPEKFKMAEDESISFNQIFGTGQKQNIVTAAHWTVLQWKILTRLRHALPPDKFEMAEDKITLNQIFGTGHKQNIATNLAWTGLQMAIIKRLWKSLPPQKFKWEKGGSRIKLSEIFGVDEKSSLLTSLMWNDLQRSIIFRIERSLPKKFKFTSDMTLDKLFGVDEARAEPLTRRWLDLKESIIASMARQTDPEGLAKPEEIPEELRGKFQGPETALPKFGYAPIPAQPSAAQPPSGFQSLLEPEGITIAGFTDDGKKDLQDAMSGMVGGLAGGVLGGLDLSKLGAGGAAGGKGILSFLADLGALKNLLGGALVMKGLAIAGGLTLIIGGLAGIVGGLMTSGPMKGLLKIMGKASLQQLAKRLLPMTLKGIKRIPFIGALVGVGFGISRMVQGDFTGGLMEFGSALAALIPVVGTPLSFAIDMFIAARDIKGGGPEKLKESAGNKWWLEFLKAFKKLPIISTIANIGEAIGHFAALDWKAGFIKLAFAIPGAEQVAAFMGYSSEEAVQAAAEGRAIRLDPNSTYKKMIKAISEWPMFKWLSKISEGISIMAQDGLMAGLKFFAKETPKSFGFVESILGFGEGKLSDIFKGEEPAPVKGKVLSPQELKEMKRMNRARWGQTAHDFISRSGQPIQPFDSEDNILAIKSDEKFDQILKAFQGQQTAAPGAMQEGAFERIHTEIRNLTESMAQFVKLTSDTLAKMGQAPSTGESLAEIGDLSDIRDPAYLTRGRAWEHLHRGYVSFSI